MRLERILSALYGSAWAIMPESLETIMQICLRNGEGPEALSARLGRPLDNTRTVTVENGVAVIPITGPIVPRASQLEEVSGVVSLSTLARDLHTALNDSQINAILLDIDSPGGVASGIAEFAEDIRAANAIKPVTAYVSGYAASAAYWIASAAGEIVAHKSASLGSVGVVIARRVQEGLDLNGYKEFEIVSSNAANKRPDPRTEEGMAEIKAFIDDLEAEFIASVAEYRSLTPEIVTKKFGQGGMLIAEKAIKAGMADRLGSYEETLSGIIQQNQKGALSMPKTQTSAENVPAVTAESIRQSHPDISQEIRQEGYDSGFAAGAVAERERIAGIDELARAGNEDLIAKAKADGKSTAADVAIAMVKQDNAAGKNRLAALETEAAQAPVITPAVDPAGVAEGLGPDATTEERAKHGWSKMDDKEKAGYGNKFDIYVGALKAEEKGMGRIKSSR